MVGALIWRQVEDQELTTAEAANLLYRVSQLAENAAKIFGNKVSAVDDFFNEWILGPERADKEVREMLQPFAGEARPII